MEMDFTIDDKTNQETCEELFGRFGRHANIKAIKIENQRDDITSDHWISLLLRQYCNHLKKLTIEDCSFANILEFLSEHIGVECLVIRYVYTENAFVLPEYRHLRTLDLDADENIVENLAETIQNNPALESLILDGFEYTLHDMLMIIAMNCCNLTELHLTNFVVENLQTADPMIWASNTCELIETLAPAFTKLVRLHLMMSMPESTTFILPLLRKFPSLEIIEIESKTSRSTTIFRRCEIIADAPLSIV